MPFGQLKSFLKILIGVQYQNAAGLYCIRKGRALPEKPLPYALFQQIVRHLRDHGVVVSILTALPDDQTGNAFLLDEVQLVL